MEQKIQQANFITREQTGLEFFLPFIMVLPLLSPFSCLLSQGIPTRRITHAISLVAGGLGLISIIIFHTPESADYFHAWSRSGLGKHTGNAICNTDRLASCTEKWGLIWGYLISLLLFPRYLLQVFLGFFVTGSFRRRKHLCPCYRRYFNVYCCSAYSFCQ